MISWDLYVAWMLIYVCMCVCVCVSMFICRHSNKCALWCFVRSFTQQ